MGELIEMAERKRQLRGHVPGEPMPVIIHHGAFAMCVCRPLAWTPEEAIDALPQLREEGKSWVVTDEESVHPVWDRYLGVCPDEPRGRWHFMIEVLR